MKRLFTIAAVLGIAGTACAQSYTPSMRYPNPDGDMNSIRQRGPCSDPWITVALEIVYGRANPELCTAGLYNGGRWGNFNELVQAVAGVKAAVTSDPNLRVMRVEGTAVSMLGVFNAGTLVAAGGGNLVAAGGGNLVAAGGGNLVAAGGGNAVAISGNRLVAAGGGNVQAPVATLRANAYGLQSGRSLRLRNGAVVAY